MGDYAVPFAALPALILWCAWREQLAENRRDAKRVGACDASGVLVAAAVWLA
ncbi:MULTISPECIES: hypothetical protein [unclassified Polaromonas]|jgi:hypothetical protein|uniref:hypothetical protein n=1 Tax=unclassified Polaromonas TaxID=2638319 RepID=UPI0025FE810E|nr:MULTISPECIES: hypothetical protein [unclassified Polaromonas]HQR98305.1 hypothetical protein [Polaromonas sp.]HQS86548.1 hypothetical protein [Polaromonas sp.]HQT06820.1 hypothetical protein [Polaromonas sp.]